MQTETPEKAVAIKLSELSEQINNEFKQSNSLAVEALKSGSSAIKAAIRTGGLLTKAKRIVGHGNWENWLANNCPEIGKETARRWMALSKTSQMRDLKEAKNLTDAYRAIGLIPDVVPKSVPTGTAPVDIFEQLFKKFDRGLGPIVDIAADFEVADMPADMRHRILERAEPVVAFVGKLKALEEK